MTFSQGVRPASRNDDANGVLKKSIWVTSIENIELHSLRFRIFQQYFRFATQGDRPSEDNS